MKQRTTFLILILLAVIIISGMSLSLNVGNSTNSLFAGQNDSHLNSSSRVVIIAPHPDDESIGAGGLIQKLKKEGKEVHCVLLTSGNSITNKVPICDNYYGLNVGANATLSERKKIIREDSFKRVMSIYNCSYEMLGIDDGKTEDEIVFNVMDRMRKEGYGEFYTTTGDYNTDHLHCHNAMKLMLEKYPELKYRQFPIYWHASPKYKPMPINADNYTDYDVTEFLPKKKEAFEVYYNINIFKRGSYNQDIERIYYIN